MKPVTHRLWFRVLALCLAATHLVQAVTINLTVGILRDHNGNELPDGSTLMVIASTANDSFGDLTSPNQASDTSFVNEADDRILARFALDSNIVGVPGAHQQAINFTLGTNNINAGNPLIFVWYVGLNEAGNPSAPGPARRFGTYRASDWVVPGDNSATIFLTFQTESAEGEFPDSEGYADQITRGAAANTPPTARCRDLFVSANASCLGLVEPADVDDGSSDPDGDPITLRLNPTGPYPKGVHPVTLIVADNRGGTNTCAATVTVLDTTNPTITCPPNIVTNAPPGQNAMTITFPNPTGSDNCPGVTFSTVPPSGSSFPIGSTIVTGRAIDAAGNTNTCTFTVTVNPAPNQPPVALCRNVTKDAGTNCTAVVTPAEVNNGSSDPDGDPLTFALNPPGPYPRGTNAVTLIVADNRGGTNTCAAQIIVRDATPPVVVCPADITVPAAAGAGHATVNFPNPTITDNCGVAGFTYTPPSGSSFPVGTTTVTCAATDIAGNTGTCTFRVIVTATTEPCVLVCPTNLVVHTGSGATQCGAIVNYPAPQFSGGCGSVVSTPASGSFFPVGTTTVNVTTNGSFACSFTVTVVDKTPPTVTCPAPVTVTAAAGEESAIVNYGAASVTDNCPGATVQCSPPSGSSFPIGTNTVTCAAVDAAGNTNTCQFAVIVRRARVNQPPTAICRDVTKSAGASCTAMVAPAEVDNGSTDPDGSIVTRSLSPAGPYPVGQTIVTLAVVDNDGAESTCQATVTVLDNTPPTVTCPANQTVNVPAGQNGATVNFPAPTASDNCGSVTVSASPASGTFFGLGTTPVRVTAVDAAGNTNTCAFTVTVREVAEGACDTIEELRARIATLDVNRGRQRALGNQLTLWERAQSRPRLGQPDRFLEQFIRLVENFQQAGALDAATAAELIACARNIAQGN